MPGLLDISSRGLAPDFEVVGTSLESLGDEAFRELAWTACESFGRPTNRSAFEDFASRLTYVGEDAGARGLATAVTNAESRLGARSRRLHYLSVPPTAAEAVVTRIAQAGLVERSRVIVEKPFGVDLETARHLNAVLHRVFAEEQIFRIDHFLGKEAAQNILALRFANGLFEPIWNRNHIEHVQIDVPESIGLEGRAAFYEGTGAYRDMVVTHLLQVLAFIAMEPPDALTPGSISAEKDKVFRSLRPIDPAEVIRGQYDGYRAEPGVHPASKTETFVALRCAVDNWRWSGVPFYLRTGKRLADKARIISIAFREPPKSMFPVGSGAGQYGPDHLTFDLDEAARLSLSFYGKRPGPGMELEKLSMQFSIEEAGRGSEVLEAYERLILDALAGDSTLFTTSEGIERLWAVSDSALASQSTLHSYPPGSWGPDQAHALIAPRSWRLPFARSWRSAEMVGA